jgi:hypothetical protein
MGSSSDAPIPETEEWISAASAVALLGMKHLLGTRTICKRAYAGLIKARAARFIRDGESADNVDVPVEFWWAEGGAALDQNWTTGDFDTWIDHRIHLQAFGVTFRRSDIERSNPVPVVENAASSALTPARALEEKQKTAGHDTINEAESTPDKTTTSEIGTVFVSYSHDSPAHARAVLCLSNRLRSEGIDCVLDQYESSPREGWPQWMDGEIKKAQFVLMICTEAYLRRVNGNEKPGIGLGVAWEGNLICNHIYNAGSRNTKFIPVVFDAAHAIHVPTPIQGATRYNLGAPDGYERLYSRLIGKPPAEKPPLGKRQALPQKEVRTTFSYPSRTVETLAKLDLHLREAMDYLQAMARAVRFEGEVSDEEYRRLCNASAASARTTLAEGRLFIPSQLVEQCERFLGCLLQGSVNYGNARSQDVHVEGQHRAAFWNKAADIAYKELPVILNEFETAARGVIDNQPPP